MSATNSNVKSWGDSGKVQSPDKQSSSISCPGGDRFNSNYKLRAHSPNNRGHRVGAQPKESVGGTPGMTNNLDRKGMKKEAQK